MFNKGDSIVSKNNTETLENGYLKLTKGKSYIISHKFFSLGSTWFTLEDDTTREIDLSLQEMEQYFYTLKETRKEKLEKIIINNLN